MTRRDDGRPWRQAEPFRMTVGDWIWEIIQIIGLAVAFLFIIMGLILGVFVYGTLVGG